MQNNKDLNDLYQIFIVVQQNSLSGIPITDALDMYADVTPRPKIKRILKEIRADMERGLRMADAFAKHPELFPDYIVEMMRINEGTGQSDDIYADIVKTLEQQIDLRRNIGSQMGQIAFLGVLLVLTVCIVVFLVLPSMGKLMMGTGMEIPWYTELLLGVGTAAQEYWWLFLIVTVLGVLVVRTTAKKNPRGLERFLLAVPLYGRIRYNEAQYRFALVFGLCKNAGLDTLRALHFTKNGCGNILMTDLLGRAIRDVERQGVGLVMALQKNNKTEILDKSYYMFLKAGERGDMGELMSIRSDFYKKQLIVASQQFSQDMQNIILAPTFGFLALILLSVLAPLFSMMSSMSGGGMNGF